MNTGEVRVSVRELVEYSLKRGSIDFEYQSRQARASEGIIAHQRLQKRRERAALAGGYSYEREVSFVRTLEAEGLEITVGGRADGVLKRDGSIFIEEIKTTETPLEKLEGSELHIAQAKCYAYFYSLDNDIKHIFILLTYYNTQTGETKELEYKLFQKELKEFFEDILNVYAKWRRFILSCRLKRDDSIRRLPFPYEGYRERQREMCVAVYRAIERRSHIFVNAPTGTGKTISALFPAVKALEHQGLDKIFYLTAKTITRKAALDAAALMEASGLAAITLVITAKDKICYLEEAVCSPEACMYADGHFNRVNAALYDILESETIITADTLLAYSRKHTVCPYEFCLDVALFADIVICDYNYAFDPRVYLRRFFAETSEKYVFLIDEAHNLADRAREMYSASINARDLRSLYRRLRKNASALKKPLAALSDELSELSAKITDSDYGLVMDNPPKSILNHVLEFCREADVWLASGRGARPAAYRGVLDLYFEFNHFLSISELLDEKFACICDVVGGGARLKLFCADPSGQMELKLKNAASAVFFSATLTPMGYFKRLLGCAETDYAVTFPSPFPRENLKVIAVAGISARFRDRERYYGDISDCMYAAATAFFGNYFAFFPSYAYMESVYEVFRRNYPQVRAFCQTRDMEEKDKESFLEEFSPQNSESLIAFAVMGGIFSEGIDLPENRLIGAFIVSVGLPTPSLERRLIANCFDKEGKGVGFEYAYVYPGMNKVLQAGGRVIRTARDKGIIILIDERFSSYEYSSLFPESWSGFDTVRGAPALKDALLEFWGSAGSY